MNILRMFWECFEKRNLWKWYVTTAMHQPWLILHRIHCCKLHTAVSAHCKLHMMFHPKFCTFWLMPSMHFYKCIQALSSANELTAIYNQTGLGFLTAGAHQSECHCACSDSFTACMHMHWCKLHTGAMKCWSSSLWVLDEVRVQMQSLLWSINHNWVPG